MLRTYRRYLTSCLTAVLFMAAAPLAIAEGPDAYKKVDFFILQDFDYNPKEKWEPTPRKIDKAPIPAFVKSLEGQRVAVYGVTMPLNFKSGAVTEFILGVSVDTCEYGATPRINEWISVNMAGGKKAQVYAAGEGTVRGVFHVKEMVENGKVVRLYSIDADSVK